MNKSAKLGRLKKKHLYVLGIAVLAVLTISFLELSNTTFLFHKRIAESGTIPSIVESSAEVEDNKNNDTKQGTDHSATQSSPHQKNPDKVVTAPASGRELLAPSGSFVSNHRPTMGEFPNEESVCITTPGASCKITFTNGSVVKTLEERQTDSNGTVVWIWDVRSAGFTEGSWKITAIASLDGKTRSSSDLQNLEVQP